MLVKEYRIPIPLTLEQYSIAQLYMIQKKSRDESEGHDSAVEILENKPYTDGPHGRGQYTYKIFHIGRHLPNWFRNIAPKSALEVHEEAWNAYPYTKTKFSVPYVEKFSIEIETVFEPDNGCQDNIFQLKSSELRQREVDVIDIVRDQLSGSDYKVEEDPRSYVSKKTGRGPLADDWVANPPNGIIMCAYKLIKVEFRYWGLQSKVERLIHDYGLRRVMLRAHRQAWAWQDEWEGLTMSDVRRLERETQLILQKKLGRVAEDGGEREDGGEEEDGGGEEEGGGEEVGGEEKTDEGERASNPAEPHPQPQPRQNQHRHSYHAPSPSSPRHHPPPLSKASSDVYPDRLHPSAPPTTQGCGRRIKRDRSVLSQHGRLPLSPSQSRVEGESDRESMYSARPEWALDSIAISDTESELEYFDALESTSVLDDSDGEQVEDNMEEEGGANLPPSSSFQSLTSEDDYGSSVPTASEPVDLLFLVVQGGAAIQADSSIGRSLDYHTLRTNMADVAQLHFHSAVGHWAIRQVPCPNLTTSSYQTLCDVNPVPVTLDSLVVEPSLHPAPLSPSSPSRPHPSSSSSFPTHLPVALMPLLTTQAPGYGDQLKAVSVSSNRVYQEFLQSPEGQGFTGQVCLVTDCMGSVVSYDILTSSSCPLTPSPTSPSRALGVLQPANQEPPSSLPSSTSLLISPAMQFNRFFSQDSSPTVSLPPSSRLKHSSSLSPLPLSSFPSPSLTTTTPISTSVGFDFEVTHFFSLGSPLGLVLASRQMAQCRQGTAAPPPPRPNCNSFYNLCYGNDPLSSRVEPLLDSRFAHLSPATVPVYRQHPKGLAEPSTLQGAVIKHPYLFGSQLGLVARDLTRKKSVSTECVITVEGEGETPVPSSQSEEMKPFSVWWSRHRLDYLLESPLTTGPYDSLPLTASTHIIHSSYWEAKEVVSFILRQVLHDSAFIVEDGQEKIPFIPPRSVEKWSRKRTAMKITRLSSNHRASDVLSLSSGPHPTLHAKFQYGPLDMVSLAKEMVDIFVLTQRGKSWSWQHLDTMTTDKHGRVSFTLTQSLVPGVHPVKLLVRGDHTTAGCNIFTVPPHTEAVVFSVDGALADNFSLSGRDMRCKLGAVEVASHWRDLGYLLIYLSGRPDMQKDYIMKFLAANGFPLGVVATGDSISTDPHLKTLYLARLIKEAKVIIQAAYGSPRHLGIYTELGLLSDQIYILSKRTSRKEYDNCQVLGSYQEHVQELVRQGQRAAVTSVTSLLGRDTCFALPGNKKPERRRRRKSRTGSMSRRKLSPKTSQRRETTV